MRLGGVIFASLGIIVVVLVANGRWSSVWAAMLGAKGSAGGGGTATIAGTTASSATAPDGTPWTAQTATSGGW